MTLAVLLLVACGNPPPATVVRTASTTILSSTVAATTTTESPPAAPPPAPPEPSPPAHPPAPVWEGVDEASWYDDEPTARDGQRGDVPMVPGGLTFAHRSMDFDTPVEFCGPVGCVVATCTDRGPFIPDRSFDLSRDAFAAVADLEAGEVQLRWRRV